MIDYPLVKQTLIFDWKELHRKIGRIVVIEPAESDIAEGNFMAQVWFQGEIDHIYLIDEWDVRGSRNKGAV